MFETLKPVLTALLLPPVPLLLLVLLGWGLSGRRRVLGGMMVLLSCVALWLACCTAVGRVLERQVLRPPEPISDADLAQFKLNNSQAKARSAPTAAIVVLGGGRVSRARELGMADLKPASIERLRYGVRLARQTGLPLAFAGGIGWADSSGAQSESVLSEAEIAARVAEEEFLKPLRWIETRSRDTRENAQRTVALLRAEGVQQIVLVTHAWHMPRALRAFDDAAAGSLQITPAPMGYLVAQPRAELEWLPTIEGFTQVRLTLRELLARAASL